jgi:hypothetical protein
MRRLPLALTVLALTLGIANIVPPPSSTTRDVCQDLCARVRCAYPTTCGPYIDASGQPACGCH